MFTSYLSMNSAGQLHLVNDVILLFDFNGMFMTVSGSLNVN